MPRGVYLRGGDGHHGRTLAPRYEIVPAGETWRDQAACHNHRAFRPETWDDSVMGESGSYAVHRTQRITAAKAVCRNECPVRWECARDVNLDWDEGIRGGHDLRTFQTCGYCRQMVESGVHLDDVAVMHRRHNSVAS